MVNGTTRRGSWLPSHDKVQRALLGVLVCAVLLALLRDAPAEARGAGELGTMFALGAMVVLDAGARLAARGAVA